MEIRFGVDARGIHPFEITRSVILLNLRAVE
jgi:hypothetical protein